MASGSANKFGIGENDGRRIAGCTTIIGEDNYEAKLLVLRLIAAHRPFIGSEEEQNVKWWIIDEKLRSMEVHCEQEGGSIRRMFDNTMRQLKNNKDCCGNEATELGLLLNLIKRMVEDAEQTRNADDPGKTRTFEETIPTSIETDRKAEVDEESNDIEQVGTKMQQMITGNVYQSVSEESRFPIDRETPKKAGKRKAPETSDQEEERTKFENKRFKTVSGEVLLDRESELFKFYLETCAENRARAAFRRVLQKLFTLQLNCQKTQFAFLQELSNLIADQYVRF